MKPEDQRIAIAEACGWKKHTRAADGFAGSVQEQGWLNPDGLFLPPRMLPDYLHDLNAIHEAEETLNDLGLNHMVQFLYEIPGRFWRATAAQRAEAFLRATGKWVD